MFEPDIYKQRRKRLQTQFENGLILFLGNQPSPINMQANVYPFRQDSSFLYFFGPDTPCLAGIIDMQTGKDIVFGNEPSVDDFIYSGFIPGLAHLKNLCMADEALPLSRLQEVLVTARNQGQRIHFLPPYSSDTRLWLYELLGVDPLKVHQHVSEKLIREVVCLREIKSTEEIREIEEAVNLTGEMILANMADLKQGESEISAAARARSIAESRTATSFPIILTATGQYLHAMPSKARVKTGQMIIQDCGAESKEFYAGDITRTIPVGQVFTSQQKEIYEIVWAAQNLGISLMAPGIEFRKVHRAVCRYLCEALVQIGLMKGDPGEAEAVGAHALFFPCGLGHAMGLDVHDMESLGEDYVGYTDKIRRSSQFGRNRLRMAKPLKPGMVLTVEPGIYFIPELIEKWKQEALHKDFINFGKLSAYKDFGGIRLEDDVLVTPTGHRILGNPIPRAIEDVERITRLKHSPKNTTESVSG
jgi:Xaa-Pro aminopeptidase